MQVLITYSDLNWERMLSIDVLHCLHTLQWQFDKSDIKVYYTPPRSDSKFAEHILQFCDLIYKENYQITYPPNLPQYQDRFWITDIGDEQAIFSDADIEFSQKKKISDLYTHDFDLCGVPDGGKWVDDIIDLFAGHILLYDNYFHRKMQPYLHDVADNLLRGEIKHFDYDRIFDEYIVTYIVRKINFRGKLIDYCHMPWNPLFDSQLSDDAYILHGGGRKAWRAGNPAYAPITLSEELYPLIMENRETVAYKHLLERLVAVLLTLIEEDNPDVNVWCELKNDTIYILFDGVESSPSLLDKFKYLWIGWFIQLSNIIKTEIQVGGVSIDK